MMPWKLSVSLTFSYFEGVRFAFSIARPCHNTWHALPACSIQVGLFLARVKGDYEQTPEALRKPLNFKDAVYKHQVCGAFLFFKKAMQAKCPETEWKAIESEMDAAFLHQHMDADLSSAVMNTVPPGDINSIAALRKPDWTTSQLCRHVCFWKTYLLFL